MSASHSFANKTIANKTAIVGIICTLMASHQVLAQSETAIPEVQGSQYPLSQTDFGGVGLLQMPSGRLAGEGAFAAGGSWNDDYHHYYASIGLFDWLDATVRYTRVPEALFSDDEDYSGDNVYTDKGIDVKFRLLEEGYWLPETAIGLRDIGGTGLFDGEFVAASKRFGPLDVTLGLGWGYLGQSGNITNPLCSVSDSYCDRASSYKGSGGSVDFERWFKGPSALYGGLEYHTPYKPLRLKLEFDGNDYSDDFVVKRGIEMPQDSSWNFGALYQIGNWGNLSLSYLRGNTLTFGANIDTNFSQYTTFWRDTPKPDITRPYTSPIESGLTESHVDWETVASELSSIAGFADPSIFVSSETIEVMGYQYKYRDYQQALDRAATILHNHAPDNFMQFVIINGKDGQEFTRSTINRKHYVDAALRSSVEAKVEDAFSEVPTQTNTAETTQVETPSKKWSYGFEPVLAQSVGGPEAFYLYSFGVRANSQYQLSESLELSGSLYLNLFDNYDQYNYVENSPHVRNHATPRVRTMFRAYVHEQPLRVDHLQLTWFEQPQSSLYTQVYAGYLEMMFAGIGAEALYRPLDQNWAIGLDANLISQRDPDSYLGVYQEDFFYYDDYDPTECAENAYRCQAYVLSQGTTGHLSFYYMPEFALLDGTLFKLHTGQFLGGDKGARLDFSKQFNSGVLVGAYATFTDLTAEEYGEGSYNKGFYLSIPLDIMTVKPTTQRADIKWEPITRDGGQMLNKQHTLFERTDPRSRWLQRPSASY